MAQHQPEKDAGLETDDPPRPSYSGIKTFAKVDASEPTELTGDVDIGVVGVPFDGAVTRQPGARYGPEALRAASAWQSRVFNNDDEQVTTATGRVADYSELEVRDCGDAPTVPNDVERTKTRVREYVETVAEHAMPVVLGGDHYITFPAFEAYANTVDGDVGLIHLDAHSDTRGDSDLYGKHYHGSPMARIDELEQGGYENHAMIGIRGHSSTEFLELVDERGIYVDYATDVHEKGIDACIEAAIEHATDGTEQVYLTMDIDSVDPAFAAGTGTPEPGGLTSMQFLRAVDLLGECSAIGAVDLMEVAPNLDSTGATQSLGANALVRFIEARFYDQVS